MAINGKIKHLKCLLWVSIWASSKGTHATGTGFCWQCGWTRPENKGLPIKRKTERFKMYAYFTFTEWRGVKKCTKIYLSVMCSGYTRGVLLEKACCCGPPCRVFPWRLFWRKICITYRGWEANQCRVTTPPYMKRHIWRKKQTVNKHSLDLKCFSHQNFFFKLWMGGFGRMWYCRVSSYWPQHSSSRTRSVAFKTSLTAWPHEKKMRDKQNS